MAETQMFEPAVRKRRLVQRGEKETTIDSAKTAEAGAWLKRLREERGLSQPQMVAAVGLKHRAAISMIESGRNRVAPGHFELYAQALGKHPREFVKQLLSFYSPEVYEILFVDQTRLNLPSCAASTDTSGQD